MRGISHLEFLAERGGLYGSIFHNSIRFCHFTCNSSVFCRLLPSLSSRMRLSHALQSLLWTSKVLKKSNMSNKPGFPCWACQNLARFQSVLRESYHLNSQSQAGARHAPSELSTSDRSTPADFSGLIRTTLNRITSNRRLYDRNFVFLTHNASSTPVRRRSATNFAQIN